MIEALAGVAAVVYFMVAVIFLIVTIFMVLTDEGSGTIPAWWFPIPLSILWPYTVYRLLKAKSRKP